jgi:hypothetical protein
MINKMRKLSLLIALSLFASGVRAQIKVTGIGKCGGPIPGQTSVTLSATASPACVGWPAGGIPNGTLIDLTVNYGNVKIASCNANPVSQITDSSSGATKWHISSSLIRWTGNGYSFCAFQVYAFAESLNTWRSSINLSIYPLSANEEFDVAFILATGVNAASPLDCAGGSNPPGNQTVIGMPTTTTTWISSTPCTTSKSGDLMVSEILWGGTQQPPPGAGWTNYDPTGTDSEYLIQGAPGTYQTLWCPPTSCKPQSQYTAVLSTAFQPAQTTATLPSTDLQTHWIVSIERKRRSAQRDDTSTIPN